MKRILIILSSLVLMVSSNSVYSQWSVAPQIIVAFPESDFANISGTGSGLGIKIIRNLESVPGVGLRGDFSYMNYGKGFEVICSTCLPSEVRNDVFKLTLGPQLSFGGMHFKAQVGARGGMFFFRTNISGTTFSGQFFQTSRDNDVALGWNAGGGIQYDIGLGPWLDVSLEYQTIYNVTTRFEREDLSVFTSDITANELTLKFGVIFFLR